MNIKTLTGSGNGNPIIYISVMELNKCFIKWKIQWKIPEQEKLFIFHCTTAIYLTVLFKTYENITYFSSSFFQLLQYKFLLSMFHGVSKKKIMTPEVKKTKSSYLWNAGVLKQKFLYIRLFSLFELHFHASVSSMLNLIIYFYENISQY